MNFERWDIVVALFPFTDADVSKPRPVVVLSDAGFNEAHGHAMVAMITTAKASSWPTDYPVFDLDAAGLREPSVIRLKLFTLPHALLSRRVGRLASVDQAQTSARLAGALFA